MLKFSRSVVHQRLVMSLMNIRRFIPFVLAAGLFSFFQPAACCAEEQLVDRVVAVVNQEVITQSELDALFAPVRAQFQETYQGQELNDKLIEARKKLLNQLIEDHLVLQEARRLGVEVTDREVEERLGEFKRQFHGKSFDEMLKAQGIKLKTLKERMRDQITIQKLHYIEIQRKVIVPPLEIEKFFQDHGNLFMEKEKVKVWSITISKNEESVKRGTMDEAARKKAESVLRELKKGKDFSELARKESHDPHAEEGGLVGYVSRGDMIDSIDQVLFQLKEGETSGILESERGYHFFKVADRQAAKATTLDESRDRIREMIFRQKANERFESWMEELKKTAFISIR